VIRSRCQLPPLFVGRNRTRLRHQRDRDGNLFDKIHADPRWLPYLRKIGKAPEQLAKIEFKVTLPQLEGATASGGSNK
jgi:hypothetical protein